MKSFSILIALIVCNCCSAAEFTNSVGAGIQYGGLIGWQGAISADNLHARVAVGLVGATVGADVNVNPYVSVGASYGKVFLAKGEALNINYYSEGKYNSGWRYGLDIGKAEWEDNSSIGWGSHPAHPGRRNFIAFDIGYAFK